MINNSVYQVTWNREFFVFFPDLNMRHEFLKNYSPRKGFGICAHEDRFRMYTNDYVFYAKVQKDSQNPNRMIGVSISRMELIKQRDTFESAIKRTQVIGLSDEYFLVKGEKGRRVPDLSYDGPGLFIDSVRRETNHNQKMLDSKKVENSDDGMERAVYLAEHQSLIEEKEKYDAASLKTVQYLSFSDTLQNSHQGVIYKFELPVVEDETDEGTNEGPFKENTQVLVSANDQQNGIKGSVVDCNEQFVYIKFQIKNEAYMRIAKQGTIVETSNPEYKMKKQAIESLRQGASNNPYILELLVNGKLQSYHKKLNYKVKKITLPSGKVVDNVNPSQKDAIERALSVEDFLLVQGPPGTGKTTIITEMVKLFVEQDKRILICSKNNLAVDNVLEKCQKLFYDKEKINKMQCLRLGKEEKVIPNVKKVLPRPLTLTIQKDVKERSAKAREQYKQDETKRRNLYETAIQETESIFELMQIFSGERTCYQIMLRLIQQSLWTPFLGPTKKREVIQHIQVVIRQMEWFLNDFWDLLFVERIMVSSKRVQDYCAGINVLCNMISRIENDFSEAKFRYGMIFGNRKEEMLSVVGNFPKHSKDLTRRMEALYAYPGNGAVSRMKKPENHMSMDCGDISQYRLKMKEEVEESKSRLFMWENVLNEWHQELDNDQNSFEDSLLKSVKIIGATCIGVNTNINFKDTMYDVAIVDEAGQITLHDLLVPFVKAKKVILIGDHLQLPPSQENEFCKHLREQGLLEFANMDTASEKNHYMKEVQEVFSVSLFERLFRDETLSANKVMLDTQFRMHPDIADFISELFYEGKYKSGVTAEERYLKIADFDKPLYFIDTCNSKERYEDIHENDKIHSNKYEAKICGKYIAKILWAIETDEYEMPKKELKNEDGDYDIGIITAYKGQIKLIRREILKNLKNYCGEEQAENILSHVAINTLDSFQGRDNQIIFYSFVRSNKYNNIGFLNEVRRLNVMMTRAKSLLVMIGDSRTLTECHQPTVHDGKDASEYFGKLVQYCRDKDGYIDAAKEVDLHEKAEA